MATSNMRFFLSFLFVIFVLPLEAQEWRVVKEHRQRSFPHSVPAGNYSGIAPLGNGRYAVVDDKAREDGYHVFRIDVDSLSGDICDVTHEGFQGNGQPNRDAEGIVYLPATQRLWMSGEADNQVKEYTLEALPTGRALALPDSYAQLSRQYGLESLAYDSVSHVFYTVNESTLPQDGEQTTSTNGQINLLRIVAISENTDSARQLFYRMDAPSCHREAEQYAMGVSELLVLPGGQLLVLERELFVPRMKIGAFVECKLYVINPKDESSAEKPLPKRLICGWRTKLNLTARSWANYEGMCLGPCLADGRIVVLLLSDSQAQYGGVLKDWWKSLVLKEE